MYNSPLKRLAFPKGNEPFFIVPTLIKIYGIILKSS